MPNYDFKCEDCGKKFSRLVPIDERKRVKCPKCESAKVKQLITGFSVINKGNASTSAGNCNSGG